MATNRILALDIGGTKLAAAVFEGDAIAARVRIATHAIEGPEAVFKRITRLLESVLQKIDGHVSSIGVGCGGPLDSQTGVIYSPPNLPGWDAYPLKTRLEEQFGVPAFVENDANAAALAEHRFGAGKGYRNVFYITASTGIGSGIILDGRLYRGTNFSAGEFGHIILAKGGPRCNCGGRGCLEALASGTAIGKRATRAARRAPHSPLARILVSNGNVSARDVATAARLGDALAQKIFSDAACYLGLGITSIIHLLNPEIVIIGGGLVKTGSLLFEPLRRAVKKRAQAHLADFVKIVPAALGGATGLYGALAVARLGMNNER